MTRIFIVVAALAWASLCACESHRNNSAWSTKPVGESQVATAPSGGAASTATPSTITSGKGIGPVDDVDLASLDESNEEIGAKLFQEKCSACHKIEERYIGPALTGVTERREPEWILNMILNPEVMVAQDPTAKALLAQYVAPMANQHLTREQAECILVYFREHDEEAREADREDDEDQEEVEAQPSSAVGQAAGGH
jgi:mono/diheme cytochrome c family protein